MITVVMTTYCPKDKPERANYAAYTLEALTEHLKAPQPLRLHIADDGSYNTDYIGPLMWEAKRKWLHESSWTNSNRHGIGASLNLAMEFVDDYWFYITDDWLLTEDLDLTHALYLLDTHHYDMVRLGPIHPFLWCLTQYTEGGWHLQIDPKWMYAFATRPFIAKPSFYHKVGPFDADRDAYDTETLYAQRVMRKAGELAIAFDGKLPLLGPWVHIGKVGVGFDR